MARPVCSSVRLPPLRSRRAETAHTGARRSCISLGRRAGGLSALMRRPWSWFVRAGVGPAARPDSAERDGVRPFRRQGSSGAAAAGPAALRASTQGSQDGAAGLVRAAAARCTAGDQTSAPCRRLASRRCRPHRTLAALQGTAALRCTRLWPRFPSIDIPSAGVISQERSCYRNGILHAGAVVKTPVSPGALQPWTWLTQCKQCAGFNDGSAAHRQF